jgi:hypothetical protein
MEIELELICMECGNALDADMGHEISHIIIKVNPCLKCTESKIDEGYEQGHEKGYKEGMEKNA